MTRISSKPRFKSFFTALYRVRAFIRYLKWRLFLKRNIRRSLGPEVARFMAEFDKACPDDHIGRKYKMECIESALRAYCSLCADGHSGYSIFETMSFLKRMVEHKPLTPLTGDESEWNLIDPADEKDNFDLFQSRRSPSVFKKVYADKTVYNDVDRVVVRDIDTGLDWYCGFYTKMVDDMFPVEMPYMPSSKKFIVEVREFDSVNAKPGFYDTVFVSRIIPPEGIGECINLNKMYKEVIGEDGKSTLVEIDEKEYGERYANYLKFIDNRENN